MFYNSFEIKNGGKIMILKLNIYTDDTLTEIKKVVEADRLKIPYRVAMTVAQSLDELELNEVRDTEVIKFLTGNIDKIDKIIKATFGVSDSELECVDVTELTAVASELFKWGVEKINSLKGDNSKN